MLVLYQVNKLCSENRGRYQFDSYMPFESTLDQAILHINPVCTILMELE